MGEPKFTKGPWWACIGDDQPVAYYRGLIAFVSTSPAMTICTGEHGDKDGRLCDSSEWEANAHLIAAAPDLFKALTEAYDLIVTFGRPETSDRHHEACEKIRAVLLKASPGGTKDAG